MHKQQQKRASKLFSTSYAEQNLLASELHDSIGQALAILKTDLFLLEKSLPQDQEDTSHRIQSMNALLDHTIHAIRKISSELKPIPLKLAGLEEAIKDYLHDLLEETGIQGDLEIKMDGLELTKCHFVALYQILHEALDNVKWHSRATRVRVALLKNSNDISLVIIDNGIGIRAEELNNSASFGIIGMKEYADFLGAELEIDGVPRKGTSVKINFQIPTD